MEEYRTKLGDMTVFVKPIDQWAAGNLYVHSLTMMLSIRLSAPEMRRLAEMLANCAVEIDRAQNRVAGESAGHAV